MPKEVLALLTAIDTAILSTGTVVETIDFSTVPGMGFNTSSKIYVDSTVLTRLGGRSFASSCLFNHLLEESLFCNAGAAETIANKPATTTIAVAFFRPIMGEL